MSAELSRRGVFGVAAAAAATALPSAPAIAATTSLAAGGADTVAVRMALGISSKDKLGGVVGLMLRRAKEGETPTAWVGFDQNDWNGGQLFNDEHLARWAAAENWDCVRELTYKRARLKQQLNAAHIPVRDYRGDFVMLSDDRVTETSEAADYLFDDGRCWAWAAEEEAFCYDVEEALDGHLHDWFEDADSCIPEIDRAPLRAAWAAIMAKHSAGLTRYGEDHKRLVVFNENDFAVELYDWAERLALIEAAIARIKAEGPPATHLLHVTVLVKRIARALNEPDRRWRAA
jgi:hypothetical protein